MNSTASLQESSSGASAATSRQPKPHTGARCYFCETLGEDLCDRGTAWERSRQPPDAANTMLTLHRLMVEDWNFGPGGLFARVQDDDAVLPPAFKAQPLTVSAVNALKFLGVVGELKLREEKLWLLFADIERQYKPHQEVPYHNNLHATDVVQSAVFCVHAGKLLEDLPYLAVLALVFGAAAHDVGHPGTSNSYQVNTKSQLALTYSNKSVLERYHIALASNSLRKEECDIYAELGITQAQQFRSLFSEMILATDLEHHEANLAEFHEVVLSSRRNSLHLPHAAHISPTLSIKCSTLLHCADMGCSTKAWPVYQQWIDRLFEEFYRQGAIEKTLGFQPVDYMDRTTSSPAQAQERFINETALRTFTAISTWIPQLKPILIGQAQVNLKHLADVMISEREKQTSTLQVKSSTLTAVESSASG